MRLLANAVRLARSVMGDVCSTFPRGRSGVCLGGCLTDLLVIA
jgi:hypothetical protein